MRRVVVASSQFKVCGHCESQFARKSGRTNADWDAARFCSVHCLRAWQKSPDGGAKRKGSSGEIAFCGYCDRTFWRVGSQEFCRDPACRDARNRDNAIAIVERDGTPEQLEEMKQKMRELELENLIDEQWHDSRYGGRAGYGMRGGDWIWWMTHEDLDWFYQNDIQTKERARPRHYPKVKRVGAFGPMNSLAVFR